MAICRGLLLTVVSCAVTWAQVSSSAGDIRGTVTDASGGAVAKARVSATNKDQGVSRSVESDESGAYTFVTLPPAVYNVRVEAAGFTTQNIEAIEVTVGAAVRLPIALTVGAVATEVSVTGNVSSVEPERTQQANTIEQRRINNLPINRRNYLDFALLAPGVVETTTLVDDTSYRPIQTPNSGLSFGGSNGRGNGFFIDGVENYQGSGGVRPSVSQEAASEFQINRNSFSAEFGNASGGVINIITKSGGNDFHGNLFGFLRHRDIQARNYFDPGKAAFTRTQSGGTIGGPLRKDKDYFFVSFEQLYRHETNFIPILQDRSEFNGVTTSQNALFTFLERTGNPLLGGLARLARAQLTPGNNPRVLDLFNRNSGTFPFNERLHNFSLRLDHKFSDTHTLFLRSSTSFNQTDNSAFGALDGFNRGRSVSLNDTTAMLSDTVILSPQWVMETRGMFNYSALDVIPNDANGPEININGYGFFGRQIFLPYRGIERHFQFLQNFTFSNGQHTVKMGYDINPVRNSQQSDTFFGGRFTFSRAIPLGALLASAAGDPTLPTQIAGILGGAGQAALIPALSEPITALQSYAVNFPILYQQGFGDPNYIVQLRRNNFYVEDTWKVRRNLTLNVGLRYDLELHNRVVPTSFNKWGPRFGFAWSPGTTAKWAVRGGYGLFYSAINTQIAGVADPLSGRFINQVLTTALGSAFPIPGSSPVATHTAASVYQPLLARGIIGTRTINEADLASIGIPIRPGLPGSVIFGIEPDFKPPWAHQASFEIERGIGTWVVSAGYNFNRAAHLARILGRNVRYTGQTLPDGRPTFARINPLVLQLNNFESGANSFYHAGLFQLTKRFSKGLAINANYTYSKAIDESTDFNSDYSPANQLDARAERGLSPFHQKHRIVATAIYEIAKGGGPVFRNWQLAPIVQYNSWRPFNVLTGVDAQGDTYTTNKRPGFLGRNAGRGPDFVTWDMRVSRRFRFAERWSFEFIAEGFNLLNRTNFRSINNIVGDIPVSALPNPIVGNRGPASNPLAFTAAQNPRQFQFGLKIGF